MLSHTKLIRPIQLASPNSISNDLFMRDNSPSINNLRCALGKMKTRAYFSPEHSQIANFQTLRTLLKNWSLNIILNLISRSRYLHWEIINGLTFLHPIRMQES